MDKGFVLNRFVEFWWKFLSFLLLLGSVWGVVWGYYVYWVGSDLSFTVAMLLCGFFTINVFKILTLYLCPAVWILVSCCLVMRICGMNVERGGWADEVFIVVSTIAAVMSLFIYFYILAVWYPFMLGIDLFHFAFMPYSILLMYMALNHTQTEKKSIYILIGIVIAVLWITFCVYFNWNTFHETFPIPPRR